jgi:hypothetical protein
MRTPIERKWGIMVFVAHAFIAEIQVMISIKIHVFNKIFLAMVIMDDIPNIIIDGVHI